MSQVREQHHSEQKYPEAGKERQEIPMLSLLPVF